MRFLLFDRVERFAPGESLEAVKHVSLTEECLREHFPKRPLFPAALVLEAMTQALGWLVVATHEFRVFAVLTVAEDVVLPPEIAPGTTLRLHADLLSTSPKGSMGRARALVDGVEVASAGRILFGQFPHPDPAALRTQMSHYRGGVP